MEDLVDRLAQNGIYSFLDMHQDTWAPQYCGHGFPDFYSYPYDNRLYWKDGLLTFPKPIAEPEYAQYASGLFPPVTNCEQVTTSALGWIAPYVTFALGSAAQR